MFSKDDKILIVILGIVAFLVLFLCVLTYTVGEVNKSTNKANATAITEMVKEGYSPIEAGCAIHKNCNFHSNEGFEILKDLRIKEVEKENVN